MDQEIAYFNALQSAAEYRLTGTGGGDDVKELLVLDDDGVVVLTFLPAWALGEDKVYDVTDQSNVGVPGSIPETSMIKDKDINGEDPLQGGNSKLSEMGPDQTNAFASTDGTSLAKRKMTLSWKTILSSVATSMALGR